MSLSSTETATVTATNTLTQITTSTTTSTETAYATATTIASNGSAYREYTCPFDANSADNGFTSSYFKTLPPNFSGTQQSLDFASPDWPSSETTITLSDGQSFDGSQAALLLQGFFIAAETGTYTFSSSGNYIDNWGYLWTGDAAYSGWDDDNTDFQASRTTAGYYGGSTTVAVNAGDAIPLTWLWANGGGAGQSYFVITSPDGSTVTDTTGFFVQACSSEVFP